MDIWVCVYNSTIYSFIWAVIHIIGNGYEHTEYLCMYISEDNNKKSEKDGFENKGASRVSEVNFVGFDAVFEQETIINLMN